MTGISYEWPLVLATTLAASGCGKSENCPSHNISPGDRFKITINFLQLGEAPCSLIPLRSGDSFVVTAGIVQPYDATYGNCYTYAATPEVPDFAKGLIKSCSSGNQQLGLQCSGATTGGCVLNMDMQVGEVPSALQGIIEHSGFEFSVFGGREIDGGGVCSVDSACGLNQFDVRIERLPPIADAGG
jgi:hypothetical protein